VLVYVEGDSDRLALESIFHPLIVQGQRRGVGIRLLAVGDKAALLRDAGTRAADHLAANPDDWVFAVPDLYPMAAYEGTEFAHRSLEELRAVLRTRFERRADKVGVEHPVYDHFRVHCMKHDLEVLLLAAPDALRRRLRTKDALRGRWRNPVEDQNDGHPPKRVVEQLFDQYRGKPGYVDTVDAPWILNQADIEQVVSGCPQCFGPLVAELRNLVL
jgi:hypothetical protein